MRPRRSRPRRRVSETAPGTSLAGPELVSPEPSTPLDIDLTHLPASATCQRPPPVSYLDVAAKAARDLTVPHDFASADPGAGRPDLQPGSADRAPDAMASSSQGRNRVAGLGTSDPTPPSTSPPVAPVTPGLPTPEPSTSTQSPSFPPPSTLPHSPLALRRTSAAAPSSPPTAPTSTTLATPGPRASGLSPPPPRPHHPATPTPHAISSTSRQPAPSAHIPATAPTITATAPTTAAHQHRAPTSATSRTSSATAPPPRSDPTPIVPTPASTARSDASTPCHSPRTHLPAVATGSPGCALWSVTGAPQHGAHAAPTGTPAVRSDAEATVSPAVLASQPDPNLRLLPNATLPAQWRLGPTDPDVTTALLGVADAITAHATRHTPFVAGRLRTADFERALLPYDDVPDLPRPILLPVALAAVTDGGDVEEQPTPPRWLRRRRARQAPQELRDAAADVIASKAMSMLRDEEARGWAPLFTVEQGEKHRLIYDLRCLNSSLADPSFTMETLTDLPLIAAGCLYGGKLDLKSAFWQVPVADDLRRYLATDVPGQAGTWAWDVLPMGLSHSPRIFTELLRPLLMAWRARGMRVLVYLDDIGLFAPDAATYAAHAAVIVRDLTAAGLLISPAKAFLAPLQRFEFLGLLVDLPAQAFVVPTRRIQRIAEDAAAMAAATTVPRTDLQALLGRIGFAALACPFIAYYRANIGAAAGGADACSEVRVTEGVREELQWWAGDEPRKLLEERVWKWSHTRYTRLYASRTRSDDRHAPTVRWARSDASEEGVGLRWQGVPGVASEPLPRWLWDAPSAARELYGMCRVIERGKFARGEVVRLVCDAQAAVATVIGPSVAASTARVARRLFESAMSKGVILSAEWLPRDQLQDVDAGSRISEGQMMHAMVPEPLAREAWKRAGFGPEPEFEPFTDVHNRMWKHAKYGSHHPMPGTSGDALGDDRCWTRSRSIWCNPPFALWRPVIRQLQVVRTASPSTRICAVLPDIPLVRERMRGWDVVGRVNEVLAPPRFVRTVPAPTNMIIFASSHASPAAIVTRPVPTTTIRGPNAGSSAQAAGARAVERQRDGGR